MNSNSYVSRNIRFLRHTAKMIPGYLVSRFAISSPTKLKLLSLSLLVKYPNAMNAYDIKKRTLTCLEITIH